MADLRGSCDGRLVFSFFVPPHPSTGLNGTSKKIERKLQLFFLPKEPWPWPDRRPFPSVPTSSLGHQGHLDQAASECIGEKGQGESGLGDESHPRSLNANQHWFNNA